MKTPYKLSKDYDRLYELVRDGNEIPCWVNYVELSIKTTYRDICRIRKSPQGEFAFLARGIQYGWNYSTLEKDLFIQECQRLNVEYIEV